MISLYTLAVVSMAAADTEEWTLSSHQEARRVMSRNWRILGTCACWHIFRRYLCSESVAGCHLLWNQWGKRVTNESKLQSDLHKRNRVENIIEIFAICLVPSHVWGYTGLWNRKSPGQKEQLILPNKRRRNTMPSWIQCCKLVDWPRAKADPDMHR